MNGNLARSGSIASPLHPNDVDRKRIERAIAKRKRYRYVTPSVLGIPDGYAIVSPCCSRNIDPSGGVIDIAKLEFLEISHCWRLYRKDHGAGRWLLHGDFPALVPILELLNDDPQRKFWQ